MVDAMDEAIALSSRSGKMSTRARRAAEERIRKQLFGKGLVRTLPTESEIDRLLRQGKELFELAARGMKPRAYRKQAEVLLHAAQILQEEQLRQEREDWHRLAIAGIADKEEKEEHDAE